MRIPIIASAFLLMLTHEAHAQTLEVIASGSGITADLSTKAAIRAAVEQAVGQLVDASTLVKNDEVVSDKILTYSGGYVDGYEMLGQPAQGDGGLFVTKIKARVKKTELVEKLRAENVTVAAVKGTSLFGEMLTKQQQMQDAAAILEEDFKDVPLKLLTAGVVLKSSGEPCMALDEVSGKVTASVVLQVDMKAYDAWVKSVCAKLDVIADGKVELKVRLKYESAAAFSASQIGIPPVFQGNPGVDNIRLTVMRSSLPDCSEVTFRFYSFSKGKSSTLANLMGRHLLPSAIIKADLKGSQNSSLGSGQAVLNGGAFDSSGHIITRESSNSHSKGADYFIMPSLAYSAQITPEGTMCLYFYDREKSTSACNQGMNMSIDLGKFSAEQLREAAEIKCSVVKE